MRAARVVDILLSLSLFRSCSHSAPRHRLCFGVLSNTHFMCFLRRLLLLSPPFGFFFHSTFFHHRRARLARVEFIEQCNVIIVDFVVGIDNRACYRGDSHFMKIHATQLNIKFIHTRSFRRGRHAKSEFTNGSRK